MLPLAILGGGLVLRLVLAVMVFPGQGLCSDLAQFASWAASLARSGPGGFFLLLLAAWVVTVIRPPALPRGWRPRGRARVTAQAPA